MPHYARISNHVSTYEFDNVPDHRSRAYGCSHALLARKKELKPKSQLATSSRQRRHLWQPILTIF